MKRCTVRHIPGSYAQRACPDPRHGDQRLSRTPSTSSLATPSDRYLPFCMSREVPLLRSTTVRALVRARGGAWRKRRREESTRLLQEVFGSSPRDDLPEPEAAAYALLVRGFGKQEAPLLLAAREARNARQLELVKREIEDAEMGRKRLSAGQMEALRARYSALVVEEFINRRDAMVARMR